MKDASGREIRVGAWVVCAGCQLVFGLVRALVERHIQVQTSVRLLVEDPGGVLVLDGGQVPHHVVRAVRDMVAVETRAGVERRLGA